jgi:hypothetical protein
MRIHHRILLAAGVVTSAGAGLLAAAMPAQASSAAAEVTVVHGIPAAPVTVYEDGKVLIKHFVFGNVVGPIALKPGTYAIAIRNYGAKVSAKPILAENLQLTAGEDASIVAGLNSSGKADLSFFQNPTSSVPKGYARLVVHHLAAAPSVDIYAGKTKIATKVTNGEQSAVSIPPGVHTLKLDVSGTQTIVLGPTKYTLKAGTTTVLYVIGSSSGKTLAIEAQTY